MGGEARVGVMSRSTTAPSARWAQVQLPPASMEGGWGCVRVCQGRARAKLRPGLVFGVVCRWVGGGWVMLATGTRQPAPHLCCNSLGLKQHNARQPAPRHVASSAGNPSRVCLPTCLPACSNPQVQSVFGHTQDWHPGREDQQAVHAGERGRTSGRGSWWLSWPVFLVPGGAFR